MILSTTSIVRSFLAVVLFVSVSSVVYAQSSIVRENENKILDGTFNSDRISPRKGFRLDTGQVAAAKCFDIA